MSVSVGCRALRLSPTRHHTILFIAGFVAAAIGFVGTTLFIKAQNLAIEFQPVHDYFRYWIAALALQGSLALVALVFFVANLIGVWRLFDSPKPSAIVLAVFAALVPLATLFAALFFGSPAQNGTEDSHLEKITHPLTVVEGLCLAPGLVVFMLLRAIARQDSEWHEGGNCGILLLRRLHTEERRTLAILGGFLTLVVITTGLHRQLIIAVSPGSSISPTSVILYGLVFVAFLGVYYGATSTAIAARAIAIVDQHAPLPAPDAPDLKEDLDRRRELESLVSVSGGTWQTVQSVATIGAPLLIALVGSALGA